jgi:hypothetical protein
MYAFAKETIHHESGKAALHLTPMAAPEAAPARRADAPHATGYRRPDPPRGPMTSALHPGPAARLSSYLCAASSIAVSSPFSRWPP